MRLRIACAVACLCLSLALPALAANDWTAVASTGAIDNTALGFYATVGPNLSYLGGSPALNPIIARYNVTNTNDNNLNPDQPGWTTLELGYTDTGATNAVSATLFQVDPCTGATVALCTVNSVDGVAGCGNCVFPGPIDFSVKLYFVEVKLTRAVAGVTPIAKTLRIF